MFITKLNFRLRPRPHYAGGNWKRCFHSENSSNVFRPQKKKNKTKQKNGTIAGHFGFVLSKTLAAKSHDNRNWLHRSRKALFLKCFPSTRRVC